MATADSYSRIDGPVVTLLEKRQESYDRGPFAPVTILARRRESYDQIVGIGVLDSTDTAVPRIENLVQRADENIGDLTGKIYNSTGNPITLVGVLYSAVSESGPFTAATILTSDPLYNLPNGSAAGQTFNIPIEITEEITGDIWIQIEISYA